MQQELHIRPYTRLPLKGTHSDLETIFNNSTNASIVPNFCIQKETDVDRQRRYNEAQDRTRHVLAMTGPLLMAQFIPAWEAVFPG
jgi:hypothetical protein